MSYYNYQGAPIAQAVGEYFPGASAPVAKAFKDGVFGRQLDENTPGPLMARADGSLGRTRRGVRGMGAMPGPRRAYQDGVLGGPLYVNGQEVDAPMTITHGNTLGPAGANGGETVSDGGTLGAGASEGNAGPSPETVEGPLVAFQDGILGNPPYIESMPGPLMAQYGGTVGAPPYAELPQFSAPVSGSSGLGASLRPFTDRTSCLRYAQEVYDTVMYRTGSQLSAQGSRDRMIADCNRIYPRETRYQRTGTRRSRAMSGLGAASAGVLDMTDAATVRELKTALAYGWGESLTQENQRIWDAAFFESPIWGPKASDLTDRWAAQTLALPDTGDLTRAALVVDTPRGSYLTAQGVGTLIALGVGAPMVGLNFAGDFPILSAWMAATQQDPASASVTPPYFSESDRTGGGLGINMSTVALVGLGAVGLIGAVIVLGGRRKLR